MPKRGTKIEWTHLPDGYLGVERWGSDTWNPLVGCTRVSPGCDNCYALRQHNMRFRVNTKAAIAAGYARPLDGATVAQLARAAGVKLPLAAPQYDVPFSQVQLIERRVSGKDSPLRKRAPHCYFVNSLSDLFHPDVPDDFIDRVFAVMALTPQHTFMVLTKRPERMRGYFADEYVWPHIEVAARVLYRPKQIAGKVLIGPLLNIWLGVSVEDQDAADERIPLLLDTPAAVRFISAEPLLGPVDIRGWLGNTCENCGEEQRARVSDGLAWVIVGGESGPQARPMDEAWVASIYEQCQAAGVPYFGKQRSGSRPGLPLSAPYDLKQWPELRP